MLVDDWSLDCLATNANAGVAQLMNFRANTMIFLSLFMYSITGNAHADGGQVIATATLGQEHAVMMVNPSPTTVGIVTVIVRVSAGLLPAQSFLTAHGASGDAPIQCALSDDPDGLGQRAMIECSDASRWTLSARVTTPLGDIQLKGEFEVAPAPAKWQSQSPWILAWVPIAGILFIRQVARRHANHYDASVEPFSPTPNS